MNNEKVRVRFAPSPTGYLHVGHARTAIYNWLLAKKHGGKFILRIEDTDVKRLFSGAIEGILESMSWLGINWDEGPVVGGNYGPYQQSKRMKLYRNAAYKLLEEGKAYRCFCEPKELEERRRIALKEKRPPMYDERCRKFSETEIDNLLKIKKPFAIRLAIPETGITEVCDLIHNKITFENEFIEDLVLLRSNGDPTYNHCVVVDDNAMKISLVIRGDDHIPNTPKQVNLYKALGYPIPQFAHLPMILGSDGSKLSKRHGATAINEYKEVGYLPQVMLNFLSLLGWSYDDKTTIFSKDDLIEKFSIENVSKNPAIFDIKKLDWMNGYYIRNLTIKELVELIIPFLQKSDLLPKKISKEDRDKIEEIVPIIQERIKHLSDVAPLTDFLFKEKIEIEEKSLKDSKKIENKRKIINLAISKLNSLKDFSREGIEKVLREVLDELSVKARKAFMLIRIAISGKKVSPPLFESI
ncbi:MAG: glutamate--tRNA ligase, partial [Actinobacteria bacterium]|nr:glutamate--tRNA ligase [Actinomycetota bacterium]